MFAGILLAVTATAAYACGPDIGFNADLLGNTPATKGWHEVQNWRTRGSAALYNTGSLFNEKTGRFTTNADGYFVCSTQIRLDGASNKGDFQLLIGIGGSKNLNDGLVVIDANGGSTNYRTLSVTGTLRMRKFQYASVFVFDSSDASYTIQSESGFSCHRFLSDIGFHADKATNQMHGRGWSVIGGWHTSGGPGLYQVGGGFNAGSGVYTAPRKGAFYCYANLRLDVTSKGAYYRLVLAVNRQNDVNNGLHAISGNGGSTNYRSITVAGSVLLKQGNTMSADVYSAATQNYKIQSFSGFGCHLMRRNIGFHADAKTDAVFGRGWSRVSKWEDRSSVNSELYSLGGSIASNGFYHAPATGYYQCSAQVRMDSASKGSYFRIILAINGDRDINQGLHAIDGNGGGTNYRTMRVSGAIRLQRGSTVSVWLYSSSDNSYKVQTESGFSCHMFASNACKARVCNVVNGGFEKDTKLPPIGYKYMAPTGWRGKGTIVIRTRNGPWGKLPSFAGRYFVGIQSHGSYLEQVLSGLEPGQLYVIKFAAANRPGYGDAETFRILLNGKPMLATTHPGNLWEQHLLHFVASSSTVTLRFENNSPKGDSTVFIDQVEGIGSRVCENKRWTTEGDRCYRFYSQDGLNYRQMQAKCVQAGGEMARIDNAKQDKLVQKLAGKSRAFIGATDAAVEGKWMWADGSHVTYTNWNPGEPNNYGPIGGEDCAEVNWGKNGQWNDIQCKSNDLSEGYVCSAVVSAASLAGQTTHKPAAAKCFAGYYFCPKKNCCDINKDCTCDKICSHSDNHFRKDVGCSYNLASVVKRRCADSGFSAKKGSNMNLGKSWRQITSWRSTGMHGVYNAGNHFNDKTGKFTPIKDGYFLCAVQLRLDSASNTGYFRAMIAVNSRPDVNNGMHVISGNGGSTNYRTLSVSGTLKLKRGYHVSPYVYSSSDNSYRVIADSAFSCHRFVLAIGFHADKTGNQFVSKTGWVVLSRWRTSGSLGLYAVGMNTQYFNKYDRFYAPRGGAYFCFAQVRLDSTASKYMRLLLALNNRADVMNGFGAIRGTSGTALPVMTTKWTMARNVDCVSTATLAIGKQKKTYDTGVDWKKCQHTCEKSTSCAGFNLAYRKCTYFSSLSRAKTKKMPRHECWTIARSKPPTRNINYGSMTVAGTVYLNPRNTMKVYVYSATDNHYLVQSESGWGCHFMNSRIGFHANAGANQRFGTGWARVAKWQASPTKNHALYSLGGGLAANGYYHARVAGYYVCNTQVRLDSADKSSFFQLVLALNGDRSWHGAFKATEGNGGAQNYRTMRVAGTMHLNKGETVSVWVYSQKDKYYNVNVQSGFSCQLFGRAQCTGPTKATTTAHTTMPKPCAVPNGANADLAKSLAARAGWKEIKNWRSSGNAYLYNAGGSLDGGTGRFTARTDGYYLCSAQARLDGAAATSYFRMLIAINHHVDTNNGLHVIDGNGGATNYRTLSVTGTLVLKKGQYVSVWVYSSGDAYTIQSETGFSCHRLIATVGFHADKTNNQNIAQKGWVELTRWRTTGPPGLYNVDGFNIDTGRFTTPKTGAYYCFAQVRLDGASSGKGNYFRLLLAVNARKDTYNGLSDIEGNHGSSNVRTMSAAGTVALTSGSYLSVYVFSSRDASYRVQTESGWGCHQLKTRVGFHAHLKTDNRIGRGWSAVKGWVASNRGKGDEELYSWGGGISGDGFYQVHKTGYYVCAVKLRIDSGNSNSYFRAVVSLNGNLNVNGGALHTIDGWNGSTDYRTMKMAGTLRLVKGQTVSVQVYSQTDTYVRVQRESGFSCHMFAAPSCKDGSTVIATPMPVPCETDTGSNADLAVKSIDAHRGWIEVHNWRTSGDRALYDTGGNLDTKLGRFTAHSNGYYLCSTQVRLDGAAASSYFRVTIAINGNRNGNNGLHVIAGNGGSTNSRSLSVSGAIQLKKGQHTSVFIYSSGDAYKIQSESGFSCHRFSTELGFHADKNGDLVVKKVGWNTITRWRVSGQSGLYSVGGGFNLDTGRFIAPKQAVYYCYAQVRVDGAATAGGSYFRLLLALNNQKDVYNGFEAIGGNHESSNYRSMGVAGTIYMKSGVDISVNIYANKDPSYRVQSESGWGCHQMNSRYGFHADAKEAQRLGRGWTSLKTWNVNPRVKGGDKQLYSMGGGISGDGFYQVRATGYYACAVNARLDAASPDSYFRLILAINGNPDVNQGLHAISGNGGSSNYRTMKIAGSLPLQKGQTLSVYVYSSGDQYYVLQRESGFSCQMFGVCKGAKTTAPTTAKAQPKALAGKRCGTSLCTGGASRCLSCAAGLQCLTYNAASQFGTCTPRGCAACIKAKAYWLNGECRFGKTNNKRAMRTMRDCSKQYAAKNANCPKYQDCKKCITASKSKTLGVLCGWAGDTFGSCGAYNADSVFGKVNLDPKKCGGDAVVVHGRE